MSQYSNPYKIEKIGLMIKCKCFNGDESLLNKFTVRGNVTIEEMEGVTERLRSIDSDIEKWEAIDKVRELKDYYCKADQETREVIKKN